MKLPIAKHCITCGIIKPLSEFSKKSNTKSGYRSECKRCQTEYMKIWRKRRPELARKNDEKYRVNHRLECREKCKRWKIKNPEKYRLGRQKEAAKYSATAKGNIERKIRCAMWRSLRNNRLGSYWEKLLGYTVRDLKRHLKSKFTKGMTWDLLMQGKIHLDHIIPVSRLYFDSFDNPSFKFCFSLENLQPLWAEDNMFKKAKII